MSWVGSLVDLKMQILFSKSWDAKQGGLCNYDTGECGIRQIYDMHARDSAPIWLISVYGYFWMVMWLQRRHISMDERALLKIKHTPTSANVKMNWAEYAPSYTIGEGVW